ncbi:hypothetical protein EDC17_10024 [Sphingobacterium alimentarium]|uniref:Uncharacterized protein n=1 Tax=Sphingobacterium alimentarium TaxID=797292 RepID=A0A4R3W113_9SPHI|nr:hypothetical protein EDC17_10024 [Sphingobacterium alimentarium]
MNPKIYSIKPVKQVKAMSHIPILPQNLWALLKALGLGCLPNFLNDAIINTIQNLLRMVEN